MKVTRKKAEMVAELYLGFNWTPGMMQGMVDLPLYAIEAIIEQIDADREADDAHDDEQQLDFFLVKSQAA